MAYPLLQKAHLDGFSAQSVTSTPHRCSRALTVRDQQVLSSHNARAVRCHDCPSQPYLRICLARSDEYSTNSQHSSLNPSVHYTARGSTLSAELSLTGLATLASIEMELVALQYCKSLLRDRILVQIRCKFPCTRDARYRLYIRQQIEL